MIWLTWRQARAQAIVAGAALAALTIGLVVLGVDIRGAYDDAGLADCAENCVGAAAQFTDRYGALLTLLGILLLTVPGIIGVFWGAPLVARELEAGTHRLVWNQSVTRRRWLATKLLVLGLASMAVAGLFSLLLTWAASPYDAIAADRFDVIVFGARNVAPLAHALFAFVLGTGLGIAVRRTVPAMALTVLAFVAIQIAVPVLLRPQLMTPVKTTVPVTEVLVGSLTFLGSDGSIGGLHVPGAWVVSSSKLLGPDGGPVDSDAYDDCLDSGFDTVGRCLATLDLHVDIEYHPGDRYWDFQWLESLLFLGAAAVPAAFALWRIRGRLG